MLTTRYAVASLGFAVLLSLPSMLAAQGPAMPTPSACMTPEQLAVNRAYYSLTRPTSRDDQMPFFDPGYFIGTWEFASRVVDSPLGPGGESVGAVTFRESTACHLEGDLKGEDPDGKAFSRRLTLTWDSAAKTLAWSEADSRGYTIPLTGVVGGELGGLFHYHFEHNPAIVIGGRQVRIKGVSEMSSPAYFKMDMQVSIDGAPFMSFGRTTFDKQLTHTSGN